MRARLNAATPMNPRRPQIRSWAWWQNSSVYSAKILLSRDFLY
jgi:hypothetical protein